MSLIAKDLDRRGNRSWKVTSSPDIEPITVAELKAFARIDSDDEDTVISSMISAIREACELYTGRSFIEQEITLVMDFWPSEIISLPRPPLISVSYVYTTDEDDNDTEYADTNYFVDTISEPGKLILRSDATAPNNTDRLQSGYKIVYVAGYSDEAAEVPEVIRNAIKIWTTDFFENRVMDPNNPPTLVKSLLDMVKIPRGL